MIGQVGVTGAANSFAAFLPPVLVELSRLRAQIRTWLLSVGCDDEVTADIVLATSEAAANAIEHGACETQRGVSVVGRGSWAISSGPAMLRCPSSGTRLRTRGGPSVRLA